MIPSRKVLTPRIFNMKNDEQFIQRRMLLAAVLSALVMGAYIYLTPRPEPPTAPVTAEVDEISGNSTQEAVVIPEYSPEIAQDSEAIEAASEQIIRVETETFSVSFTNQGALATNWILKNYNDATGTPLELIHPQGAQQHGYPFRVVLPGGDTLEGSDSALFTVDSGPVVRRGPAKVTFEYSKDGLYILKSFNFKATGYIVEIETRIVEANRPLRHLLTWGGGFGDTAQASNEIHSQTFYFDSNEIQRIPASDAEDERVEFAGPFPFAGIADLFFTATAIPEAGEEIRLETSSIKIIPAGGEQEAEKLYAAAAFGGATNNKLRMYVGPKSLESLAEVEGVGSSLRNIVDYGFFSFLAEPLFAMLRWVHNRIIDNWGWSIILVTILINFIMFPLKYKSTQSMRKMQQLQPLVKQINDRYKGVTMRDPRKPKQNEELQTLYKKYKVNPMGGCLPLLLQMPFFFAFYKLLTVAIEMRHAEWLWVSDLSNPETLPIRILPLAMVATQFWSQSLTPNPTADAVQAKMMKFMPLLFGFIFYQFQAGLVLYWLTSNCVGVGQQLILNKLPIEQLQIDTPHSRGRNKKRSH